MELFSQILFYKIVINLILDKIQTRQPQYNRSFHKVKSDKIWVRAFENERKTNNYLDIFIFIFNIYSFDIVIISSFVIIWKYVTNQMFWMSDDIVSIQNDKNIYSSFSFTISKCQNLIYFQNEEILTNFKRYLLSCINHNKFIRYL